MSGPDPFRSELDAAHRRIETLETENAARVKDLETENARLRQRLIDVTPSRNAAGRTFAALGMLVLSLSLAAGMVFARITGTPAPVPYVPVQMAPIELPAEAVTNEPANPGDFDRGEAAFVLNHVHIEDCAKVEEPHLSGHVTLTLAPSGLVSSATIDDGPYRGTPIGRCIEERFRTARVPAFTGIPRRVGKSFVMP
jgi:hypothetical protein